MVSQPRLKEVAYELRLANVGRETKELLAERFELFLAPDEGGPSREKRCLGRKAGHRRR